jgi:hypothetical protein
MNQPKNKRPTTAEYKRGLPVALSMSIGASKGAGFDILNNGANNERA